MKPAHLNLVASASLLMLAAACRPAPATSTAVPTEPSGATTMPTDPASPTPSEAALDLRQANVVGVTFEPLGESRYRFDVTLYHDDDGEAPEYADWWQVEDLQGNLLGRRVLLHSHSTAPFTRSETIEIPDDVRVVIVRGHDMRHGYGGQVMRVNLETAEVVTVQEE